jgi:hypothetical protein
MTPERGGSERSLLLVANLTRASRSTEELSTANAPISTVNNILDLGTSGVGYLDAVCGAGGIATGALAPVLIRRSGLALTMLVEASLWGCRSRWSD